MCLSLSLAFKLLPPSTHTHTPPPTPPQQVRYYKTLPKNLEAVRKVAAAMSFKPGEQYEEEAEVALAAAKRGARRQRVPAAVMAT